MKREEERRLQVLHEEEEKERERKEEKRREREREKEREAAMEREKEKDKVMRIEAQHFRKVSYTIMLTHSEYSIDLFGISIYIIERFTQVSRVPPLERFCPSLQANISQVFKVLSFLSYQTIFLGVETSFTGGNLTGSCILMIPLLISCQFFECV